MKEMGETELKKWLAYFYDIASGAERLFPPSFKTGIAKQAYNQLVKLIEDNHAYDERIDKILEHYERLDSEPSGVDEKLLYKLWERADVTKWEDFLAWAKKEQLLSQKRVVTREWVDELIGLGAVAATTGDYKPLLKKLKELGIEVGK